MNRTSFSEVLVASRELTKHEKIRLIEALTSDLADTPESGLIDPNHGHPVWSPIDCFETGNALLRMLEEEGV